VPGVRRVLAFRDLGITSVLVDDDTTGVADIRRRMRDLGFRTEIITSARAN
jgi:copper chaperone CopZ